MLLNKKICEKEFVYKRHHSDNIYKFKQRLSDVKWQEVYNNNDASDDYNKFVETFEIIYDECIPLKKCKVKKKYHYHHGLRKGCLKVRIRKRNCIKRILGVRPMKTYKSLKHIKASGIC